MASKTEDAWGDPQVKLTNMQIATNIIPSCMMVMS